MTFQSVDTLRDSVLLYGASTSKGNWRQDTVEKSLGVGSSSRSLYRPYSLVDLLFLSYFISSKTFRLSSDRPCHGKYRPRN